MTPLALLFGIRLVVECTLTMMNSAAPPSGKRDGRLNYVMAHDIGYQLSQKDAVWKMKQNFGPTMIKDGGKKTAGVFQYQQYKCKHTSSANEKCMLRLRVGLNKQYYQQDLSCSPKTRRPSNW